MDDEGNDTVCKSVTVYTKRFIPRSSVCMRRVLTKVIQCAFFFSCVDESQLLGLCIARSSSITENY